MASVEALMRPNTGSEFVTPWATKRDWDKHREIIGELYSKMTLPKVMVYMETEHGFKATVKMYKAHVTKWGLDKNSKEEEMRAIVRKHKQRRDMGKTSTFHVRGKPINYHDVVRYWNRKRMAIDEVIAQRVSSATPKALECTTPMPSLVKPPPVMVIPERVFNYVKAFYQESSEGGTTSATPWCGANVQTKAQEDLARDVGSLYGQSLLACNLFEREKFREAQQALNPTTVIIKRILLANEDSICWLLALILRVHRAGRDEVILALLQQVTALGESLSATSNYLSQVCRWLSKIDRFQLEDVIAVATRVIGDHYESKLGRFSEMALRARMAYINHFVRHRDCRQGVIALKSLLQEWEMNLEVHDRRILRIRLALAHCLLELEDYGEAQQLCQYVSSSIHAVYNWTDQDDASLHCESLYISACCGHRLGKMESAELDMRTLIELDISVLQ